MPVYKSMLRRIKSNSGKKGICRCQEPQDTFIGEEGMSPVRDGWFLTKEG